MRIKTSELTGPALDWAVAQCEEIAVELYAGSFWADPHNTGRKWYMWRPHADWSQGGPIIERERIRIDPRGVWCAAHDSCEWTHHTGETPLIAAMRCYVASKLGDEIDVPDELLHRDGRAALETFNALFNR